MKTNKNIKNQKQTTMKTKTQKTKKQNQQIMETNDCCICKNMGYYMEMNMNSKYYYYKHANEIVNLFKNNSFNELKKYLIKNNLMDKFNNIYYFDNNTYYFIIEYLLFLCDDDNSLFQKLFDLIRFLNENGHPIDFNKKAMSENISKNIIYSKKVTHPIFILLLFFDLDKVKDIINYLLESNKIKIKETYFEDKVSIGNGIEKGDECSILDVAIYLGKFDFIKFFMEEKNIKKYNQFSLRHPADFREPHIFKYLVDNTDSFNTNFLNENGENLLFELIKYGQTSYFIKYIEKKIPKEDFEKMILHKEKPQKSFIDYCIEYKNLNVLKYLKENYFNLFKKLLENNLDASYTLIEYKALDMFVFLISNGLPYNKKELFERIKYAKQFYNKLGCIELDTMKDYIKRFEKFKNKNQQK